MLEGIGHGGVGSIVLAAFGVLAVPVALLRIVVTGYALAADVGLVELPDSHASDSRAPGPRRVRLRVAAPGARRDRFAQRSVYVPQNPTRQTLRPRWQLVEPTLPPTYGGHFAS